MEIKKTPKADLENKKSTWMLIGYVIVLAFMFIAFEWTSAISRLDTSQRLLISILKKKWFLSLNRKKKVAPPPS